jgi:hypothetical protein
MRRGERRREGDGGGAADVLSLTEAVARLTGVGVRRGRRGDEFVLGGAAGHARFLCNHCKTPCTSLIQARAHHDSKHDKLTWREEDYTNVHELHGGVTTVGVAVRGTTNAEKLKKREEKGAGAK